MPLMKKRNIVVVAVVVLAIIFAIHIANRGGPPLTPLNKTNFDQFTRSFDANPSQTRLVLLLSPT